MKDKGMEHFLKNLKAPSPDPEARLRAKRTALAEFERNVAANQEIKLPAEPVTGFKAFLRKLRLSREENSHGSISMKWYMNRGFQAGAAGLCVLAIGLAWVLPNLGQYTQELTQADAPASATTRRATPPQANLSEPVAANDAAEGRLAAESAVAQSTAPSPAKDDAGPAGSRQELEKSQANERKDERQRMQSIAPIEAYQPAPAPAPPPPGISEDNQIQPIIVTGARRNESALQEMKRSAAGSISAEEISKFPDATTAESLHRIPGVNVSKPVGIAGAVGYQDEGRDRFEHFEINPVHRVADEPVSTFSADVDTASYSFVRAHLNEGLLPQKDAVRAEEMINYFDYAWPAANSRRAPFKPTVVVSDSPWGKGRKLVHIGIKGYEIDREEAPDANLVLLLDVSGSMNSPDKLPLAVRSMEMLLGSLKPSDTVGIVVYAGAAGTVLEPTPVREKAKIVAALRSLRPGGSTAGAAGIERAYQLAEANFRKGGVNRILLATDGDFNVGIDDTNELTSFVERKREKGVYLSVLGFGNGNYRDELAQALAQNGNGVAAYIDTDGEARKVLVQEASASLFTIAKDVKLQVEFNPATVSEYRLVGYETRALKREDFNNDAVDAGDVGAGHTVTAIYEITPVGAQGSVDEPRYSGNRSENRGGKAAAPSGNRNEYGFLKIRYKLPSEKESRLISEPISLRAGAESAAVQRDVGFSTAVAGFAQLLRGGMYTGSLGYDDVIEQAQSTKGEDRFGYRAEFIDLVRKARDAAKK